MRAAEAEIDLLVTLMIVGLLDISSHGGIPQGYIRVVGGRGKAARPLPPPATPRHRLPPTALTPEPIPT